MVGSAKQLRRIFSLVPFTKGSSESTISLVPLSEMARR